MSIRLQNIHAGYGKTEVLHGITFSVEEGERAAILGANGSGKTTLLRVIAGILPAQGDVLLHGQKLSEMKRRQVASQVAMMMQVSQTYFSYTVEETVLLGRYARTEGRFGKCTPEDQAAVDKALSLCGLTELKDRSVSTLSGGQLQRVFLARTMAQDTPVILLDEPTNHLDLKIQAELMGHLKEWSKEKGHTLLGVYHDINLALSMADRFIVMKEGTILYDGDEKALLEGDVLQEAYEMDVAAYMRDQYERWRTKGL